MIGVLLVTGILTSFYLYKLDTVTQSDLNYKTGATSKPECIESRTVKGIRFTAKYSTETKNDFIQLPEAIPCNSELLAEFNDGNIEIYYNKNIYYGILLNGSMIRNTEQSIGEHNNKTSSIMFVLFLTAISIFAVYFKGKRTGKANV